jgi:prepilin-type processing-associated H-X9-DG protein
LDASTGLYSYSDFGVGTDKRYPGPFGLNFGARIDEIRDGTSNTLMIAEMIVGGKGTCRGTIHFAGGVVIMATYTPNDLTPDKAAECDSSDYYTGDAPCDRSMASDYYNVQYTSRSRHPGGVDVVMCDGSTQFVSQNIARSIWQAMATPDAGEPITSDF